MILIPALVNYKPKFRSLNQLWSQVSILKYAVILVGGINITNISY